MSYPTLLGPWYVVQSTDEAGTRYYQHPDEGDSIWTTEPKMACLFMSLQSASRIADANAGEVRVLYSREHAEEFKRD